MSHEVESMFYTSREVPWHGLGTPVDNCLCSADAIIKAGLDWDVISKPIFTDSGIEIPNYKANTRNTDNKVLGIVRDRYKIVQNKQAFEFTDTLIGNDVKYETAGSLNGGKRIWLLAKMPTVKILDDDVDPYLCFTNTFDGSGAVKVLCTNVRVVCNNTLSLAVEGAQRVWSVRHMGNIEEKISAARNTLELEKKYQLSFNEEAEKLANIKIDLDKTLKMFETLYNLKPDDSDRKKRNIEQIKENYTACWFAPDLANFVGTAWGAVNAASDLITHYQPMRTTASFAEKNFERVVDGNSIINGFHNLVLNN